MAFFMIFGKIVFDRIKISDFIIMPDIYSSYNIDSRWFFDISVRRNLNPGITYHRINHRFSDSTNHINL